LSGVAQSFSWVVPSDIAPSRTAVIQVTATDRAGNSQSATSDLLTLIGSGFAPNAQVTYQYDPLNRLTQATYQDGRVVSYTYDAAGNLATVTVK
jgi:YD repeat-containing protein